ncbi:MAG TPA: hypothetical protein VIK89_05630, partial [Cytophagaceae bacterium]
MKDFYKTSLLIILVFIICVAPVFAQNNISFSTSILKNISIQNPTSLQFGPDGKLYVAQQDGTIKVFTITKSGANNYTASATETINLVKQIPNHNDDGTPAPGINKRQVTGIYVAGTPAN